MNIDILNYVQNARKSGMADDKIREGMMQSGFSADQIEEALKEVPVFQAKPKWHPTKAQKLIAIFGTLGILIAAGGYAYTSYLASKEYNEVARQAKLAQEEAEKFGQKRAQNPLPPSIDMSDWQTYRNEEYGFEFKYPGDGKLEQDKVGNYYRIQNYIPADDFGLNSGEYYIEVYIQNKAPYNSCIYEGIENYATKLIDNREVIVSPGPYGGEAGGDRKTLCIEDIQGSRLAIGITVHPDYINLTDQIFSTFRFIESAEGQLCGGSTGIKCPSGYVCGIVGNQPEAEGKCSYIGEIYGQ